MFDLAPSDTLIRYRLFWNARRQVSGIFLHLDARGAGPELGHDWIDTLRHFRTVWSRPRSGRARARHLVVGADQSAALLQLLHTTPKGLATVAVPEELANHPRVSKACDAARQRGVDLMWMGLPGAQPRATELACFDRCLLSLSPEQALATWRALRPNGDGDATDSAFLPDHLYADVGSLDVAIHGLDQQGVLALLDWPIDDTLHAHRARALPASPVTLHQALRALDDDAALEVVEQAILQDAVLTWRLLRFLHSAAVGMAAHVVDIHQALMVLGTNQLRAWLRDQLQVSTDQPNLRPVLASMALRAHLLVALVGPGNSDALRREVHLCGLLTQLEDLAHEPLASALRGIPLPPRVSDALFKHSGPYAPYLQLVDALSQRSSSLDALMQCHGWSTHSVNQALLQTLAQQT